MKCDNCGKECKELITRQGFVMTYFIEWVCEDCFEELEGSSFSEYKLDSTGGTNE